MKKIIVLFFITAAFTLFAETTRSVGTAKANSATDKGFDALRFNPASLVFTERRFGISPWVWPNLYLRVYNNTFSSDDVLHINENPSITDFVSERLSLMPESGLDGGVQFEFFNTLCYINFSNWNTPSYQNGALKLTKYEGAYFNSTEKVVLLPAGKLFKKKSSAFIQPENEMDNEDIEYSAIEEKMADIDVAFVELKEETGSEDSLSEDGAEFDSEDVYGQYAEEEAVSDEENQEFKKKKRAEKADKAKFISLKLNNSAREIKEIAVYYTDKELVFDEEALSGFKRGNVFLIPSEDEVVKIEVTTDKAVKKNRLTAYSNYYPKKESGIDFITSNLAVGFGTIIKAESNFSIGKGIFETLFSKISLKDGINVDIYFDSKLYLDFFGTASYRLGFLEKMLPFETKISVGAAQHFYVPFAFASFKGSLSLKQGELDDDGIYGFDILSNVEGKIGSSSAFSDILKIPGQSFTDVLSSNSSFGFGLGWDLGYYMEFPFGISAGFSVTDLGFMVFPNGSAGTVENKKSLGMSDIEKITEITDDIMKTFAEGNLKSESIAFIPDTALRFGGSVAPLYDVMEYFYFIGGMNLAFRGFDKAERRGYATVEWSTGIEFGPRIPFKKYNWDFRLAHRLGVMVSSDTAHPGIAAGLGLLAGPVMMEIGVQGIEFLIKEWGAREVIVSLDMKYEF